MAKSYIKKIIKKYPEITSGRKNYEDFENRISKNISLINIMQKCKNIDEFMKYRRYFKTKESN